MADELGYLSSHTGPEVDTAVTEVDNKVDKTASITINNITKILGSNPVFSINNGSLGWSPIIVAETIDGGVYLKIIDWVGGTGEKPVLLGYIGENDIVSNYQDAINIKGLSGYSIRYTSSDLGLNPIDVITIPLDSIAPQMNLQISDLIIGNNGIVGRIDSISTDTEIAYVTSLFSTKGTQGPQGEDGNRGSKFTGGETLPTDDLLQGDMFLMYGTWEIWNYTGTTWVDTGINIKGATGGTVNWYDQTEVSMTPDLGNTGDYYFNTTTGQIFRKVNGTWTLIFNTKGSVWYNGNTGSMGPDKGLGNPYDYYLDYGTWIIYVKSEDNQSWNALPISIAGQNTQNFLNGPVLPSSDIGKDGDYYLNTAEASSGGTLNFYKKNAGIWEFLANFKGQTGLSGLNGRDGINGRDGRSITGAIVDGYQHLIISYSTEPTIVDAGFIGVGERGRDGKSITTAIVDIDGNLILNFNDNTTIDAGSVVGDKWYVVATDDELTSELGKIGDMAINKISDNYFKKISDTEWEVQGTLKGDSSNTAWFSGTTDPVNVEGSANKGDQYISYSNFTIYKRTDDNGINGPQVWEAVASLKGGEGSTVWLTGTSTPTSAIGVDNNYYMDTVRGDIFKKIDGTWQNIGNIMGATGKRGNSYLLSMNFRDINEPHGVIDVNNITIGMDVFSYFSDIITTEDQVSTQIGDILQDHFGNQAIISEVGTNGVIANVRIKVGIIGGHQIMNSSEQVFPSRSNLQFVGATITDTSDIDNRTIVTMNKGGHTIKNQSGAILPDREFLTFFGNGINVIDLTETETMVRIYDATTARKGVVLLGPGGAVPYESFADAINLKLDKAPDGTNNLIGTDNKINLSYIPQSLLTQLEWIGDWDAINAIFDLDLRDPAGRDFRQGDFIIIADAGNKTPDPNQTLAMSVGDIIIYSGNPYDSGSATTTGWHRMGSTGGIGVTSFKGRTGDINDVPISDITGLSQELLDLKNGKVNIAQNTTDNGKYLGIQNGVVTPVNIAIPSNPLPAGGNTNDALVKKSATDRDVMWKTIREGHVIRDADTSTNLPQRTHLSFRGVTILDNNPMGDATNIMVSSIRDQNSTGVAYPRLLKIWTGTEAQYTAITTKDPDTIYFTKES